MTLKKFSFKIIVALCFIIQFQCILADPCKISVLEDINPGSPMVLKVSNGKGSFEYLYPSSSWQESTEKDYKHIVIAKNEKVQFVCPPKMNKLSTAVDAAGVMVIDRKELKSDIMMEPSECIGDNTFKVLVDNKNGNQYKQVKFDEIGCEYEKKKSYGGMVQSTNQKCSTGQIYNIGFDLKNHGFLKTIEVCHDELTANNLWAHGVLVPENQNDYRYKNHGSNSFKNAGLFNNMNTVIKDAMKQSGAGTYIGPYSKAAEKKAVELLLGLTPEKASAYVDESQTSSKYLAKGHLVANGDKFYKSEQDSTYFFVNVLPMWQTINANPGYWFEVEERVRKIAFQSGNNIDIWAGGLGVLELEGKPFYLNPAEEIKTHNNPKIPKKGVNKIPVPKVLFKIAVDKKTKQALVFLVTNDPKADVAKVTNKANGYIVCETYDVCRRKMLKGGNTIQHGYLYCCKLGDFYKNHGSALGLPKEFEEYKSYKELELH